LTVQAAAKNMVCVPQMQNTYMAQYDTRHSLLPLDSMVKSGALDISGIPKNIIKGGRGQDGKLYMVGTGAATTTLVYNTTMAKKYGIPPLPAGVNWTQYQAWLLAAQKKLPKGVYAADLQGGEYAMVFAWIRSHDQQVFVANSGGGYKLGFSKQTLVDFWNWWKPLIKAGAVTPPGMMAEEPTTAGDGYIAQGKVLVDVGTSNVSADDASLAAIKAGQETPVMFPVGPKGTSGEIMDLSGLSISANCTNIPASAAWVNYFAHNPDAAAAYGSDNGAVTVSSFLDKQVKSTTLDPAIKTSLNFIKTLYTNNRPVAFYPPGYNALVPLLSSLYSDVAFGRQTPAQAADQFFSEAANSLSS
jgi:multiple sugar transport system substrate-binding protein